MVCAHSLPARLVIAAGSGERGYVKYGCHAHKHNGVCGNRLMIRQDLLEAQLFAAIGERILSPTVLNSVVERCEAELKRRLADMERQGTIASVESLKKDLEEQKRRQANLIEAIETAGDINSLTERLRAVETEISRIQRAVADYRLVRLEDTLKGLRQHVTKAMFGLRESLATSADGDFTRAKEALARHIGRLVLTPEMRDGRPVYKVTGNISVPDDTDRCRMQLVARDGIEPPPPAF